MNIIYCKSCGAEMAEVTKFCGTCGAKTEEAVPAAVSVASIPQPDVAPVSSAPVPPPAVVAAVPTPVPPPAAAAIPTPVPPPAVVAAVPTPVPPPAVAPATPAFAAATAGNAIEKIKTTKVAGMDIKKVAIIAGAAVVALIALIVLLIALSPSQYQTFKGIVHIEQLDYETLMVFPHGKTGVKIIGELEDFERSLDGTKAAMLVDEDYMGYEFGYTLYHIGSRVEIVAEDVRDFWLSANGNTIAYTKYEADDDAGELFLWDGGNPRKISNDFALSWWSMSPAYNCVISPDGKTVGFVAEKSEDTLIGIIWNNGKENELGRDFIPLAVSNNARYIYYNRISTSNDGGTTVSLNVQRGTNESTRQRLGDNAYLVAFNNDLSQVVFTRDSRSFISNKGREPVSLSGTVDGFIMPANTRESYVSGAVIYGVRSFVNTFYYNGAIIRINNSRFETDSVMRGVGYAHLANDGKTLTYSRNNSIFKVNGTASNPNPIELVGDDVWNFIPTNDGSAIFFVDSHRDLNYQRGTSRANTIAYSFAGNLALYKGNTLFYIQENELFSSTGRNGTKINGLNADILNVYANASGVYARGLDGGEYIVYRSTDGKRFTEIK
ncbi:MAG: zinc ribbon domain-containing protein [Oscillospiraceae bacterium]|jgi:hypothetical protein|nr:zinc ribbon domain-containing protein [Oscillospiraceae bacterium]